MRNSCNCYHISGSLHIRNLSWLKLHNIGITTCSLSNAYGGTGVSRVWNNPNQTLRKHYVGSTWFQIRLYLHPNETLLWIKTDFTCTKRHLWTFLYTPIISLLPISILSQPLNNCELSWQYSYKESIELTEFSHRYYDFCHTLTLQLNTKSLKNS